jgi:hypothetical protein
MEEHSGSGTPRPPKRALDADTIKRIEKAKEQWVEELKELTEPIRKSSQLTEEDFSIRINALG